MPNPDSQPRIITFYSYKGGTGRSMTLANVAWILAANGKRVAVIDWDLEAPGLHRYFYPYLRDPDLLDSTGIIDFVMAYAREAIKPAKQTPDRSWYLPHANLLRHASSLRYEFPPPGTIDFIPSGRQGTDYAARVNSFNWSAFYEKHQGGLFLEAAKHSLSGYDYVLIDSRTGVSDTSGICTVQMPHVLVVCFTPNAQSIQGASAIAASADQQRTRADGTRTLTIFPVMMRVLAAEKARVEAAKRSARDRFDGLLWHLGDDIEKNLYWGTVSVPQEAFYAFEEVLAVFGDEPGLANTMLASMEALTRCITRAKSIAGDAGRIVLALPRLNDEARHLELGKFIKLQPFLDKPKPVHKHHVPGKAASELGPQRARLEVGGPPEYWFYISYARIDGEGLYLLKFYTDLTREVRMLVPDTRDIGFLDRSSIPLGESWKESLAHALTTARTLVPIISPAFLASEYCGKEWQIFKQRAHLGNQADSGILPVLWVPIRQELPPAVLGMQMWSDNFPTAYREEGLLYLMRLSKHRDDYVELVRNFARRLVQLAERSSVPPAKELPPLGDIVSAFASVGDVHLPPSGPNVVRLVLLADSRAEMATVRTDTSAYGDAAKDWTPYRPRPVALSAMYAASRREIAAIVSSHLEVEELRSSLQVSIVIIDPWALKLDHVRQKLSELDQYAPPSWAYLLVFDETRETRDQVLQLRALVAHALENTYSAGARKIQEAHSDNELIEALSLTVTALQLELISRATATLPHKAAFPKLPTIPKLP